MQAHCILCHPLACAENRGFGAKIRKIRIPLHNPVLLYISRTCFPDVIGAQNEQCNSRGDSKEYLGLRL